ncbi:MAG TPA: GNAT family protein [Beijerinckiaceae bacterium]
MTPLSAWVAPPFPAREVLEGRFGRLEPLDVDRHGPELAVAMRGADAVWTYLPLPPPESDQAYLDLLRGMQARDDIVPYAVVDAADGRAKGHLWLMEIRPAHGVFEVGYITYAPALQRTPLATEAIYLCGRRGFDLGYRRYEWKCNDRNEPSKRAARRFGFQSEGLFRQHQVIKGENRDTAWFSILDREWPQRRLAFERWLSPENFDAAGRQCLALSDLNALVLEAGGLTLRRGDLTDVEALLALQRVAYAENAPLLGVEPLPLRADYRALMAELEVWLAADVSGLTGALLLDPQVDHLLIWSVATHPLARGSGLGNALLAAAEARAAALGLTTLRLYTGEKLSHNVAWYERRGYAIERIEALPDRNLVHMVKHLVRSPAPMSA